VSVKHEKRTPGLVSSFVRGTGRRWEPVSPAQAYAYCCEQAQICWRYQSALARKLMMRTLLTSLLRAPCCNVHTFPSQPSRMQVTATFHEDNKQMEGHGPVYLNRYVQDSFRYPGVLYSSGKHRNPPGPNNCRRKMPPSSHASCDTDTASELTSKYQEDYILNAMCVVGMVCNRLDRLTV
jgi:hypothetical protein